MLANLESYKKDLEKLLESGKWLHIAMKYACDPEGFKAAWGEKTQNVIKMLPEFKQGYQTWYSEAKVLIKQMLPDRLADFVRHYEKPKTRKTITCENYVIEDYLRGLEITTETYFEGKKVVVGPSAAISQFGQQLAILKAVSLRFESSLFDIRQLVQADLLDSELATAKELLKSGYLRASGVVAGVVLEKHLSQVVENHSLVIGKKDPAISDYNELLKKESVIDTPNWRHIQLLGDIRNYCGHKKEREPTKSEVEDLISGVEKFIKTLF
jgi:hypothetical protein